jgi:hypothetical protein
MQPDELDGLAAVVSRTMKAALALVFERQAGLEATVAALREAIEHPALGKSLERVDRLQEGVLADLRGLRERLAAIEVKALQPGPPGEPGKDGTDGLGFEDLEVVDDGTGVFFRFTRGDVVKTVRVPVPYDRGPYKPDETYEKGHCVNHNGYWIAKAPTKGIRPGDGTTPWRLIIGGRK